MKNKKSVSTLVGIIIIIAVVFVFFGGVLAYQNYAKQTINNLPQIANNNPPSQPPVIVGGACSYYSISGRCKIVSIAKTQESIQQKSTTGYEGFDVKFSFIPDSSIIIPESAKKILASQKSPYSLRLTNSWYPGQLYLNKYSIKENSIFGCQEMVISKGTCTPLSFKFSNVNLSDYFEVKN